MIRGFYTAASGLLTHQAKMDVVANNIANINTIAYKPQDAGFSSLLYSNLNGGAGNSIELGHGVRLAKTDLDLSQGDLQRTDMPMDYAILGQGFFALELKQGDGIVYTRDGSFKFSGDSKRDYLTDAMGNYVLDSRQRRIEQGESFDYKQIGVFSFKNPYGLVSIGNNQFKATEISGRSESLEDSEIQVGYLEGSAVKTAEEMVKMIEASKGFSFSSRVLQTADEMERTVNQLR